MQYCLICLLWIHVRMLIFHNDFACLQAEINYLGQLSHPNLVKLIGYCLEDEHRLLVYEFMPRGSMENHLFRSKFFAFIHCCFWCIFISSLSSDICNYNVWYLLIWTFYVYCNTGGSHFQPLSWGIRMKVALGAAKGLAFLHNAETTVIYRDFKTSNILLDSVCNLTTFSNYIPTWRFNALGLNFFAVRLTSVSWFIFTDL